MNAKEIIILCNLILLHKVVGESYVYVQNEFEVVF